MGFDDFPSANKLQKEREQYENAKQEACNQALFQGVTPPTVQGIGLRQPSEREQAEKRVGYHRTEADRADRAAAFFRDHPEFDQFIRLIREGVISI